MIPHLMGVVLICITIGAMNMNFSKILNCNKIHISSYFINNIYLWFGTFQKTAHSMGNIMWKLEDHSYSSKRAILLQSWLFDIRKNSILCIKRKLVSRYTGCPIKNGTVDFQYIASGKLSIFLRHRIKYFPQKRMTPKSLNLMK